MNNSSNKRNVIAAMVSAFLLTFTVAQTEAKASTGNDLQKLFGGIASWYGGRFNGRKTASGDIYDMNKLTCAHKTLPFGTKLLVFNPTNGKKVEVVVTDRGPYVGKRVIDLSKAAADRLAISGISNVVCYVGRKVLTEVSDTIALGNRALSVQPAKPAAPVAAPLVARIEIHREMEIPAPVEIATAGGDELVNHMEPPDAFANLQEEESTL